MPKKITIFYAWQSDTPSSVNHYFIRDAANAAIKRINAGLQLEEAEQFDLDHDTKGVPGSPPVAETICRKIDACGLFLADLTPVATYKRPSDGKRRRTLNPNVLIELGYARKSKGTAGILGIMNTAFGSPTDLPFDLQHLRHPIRYALKDVNDADLASKRQKLTSDIEFAIRTVLDKVIKAREESKAKDEVAARNKAMAAAHETRLTFEQRALTHQFRKFSAEKAILTVSLIPLTSGISLNLGKLTDDITQKLRPLFVDRTVSKENHGASVVTYTRQSALNDSVKRGGVVELTSGGEVFAASAMPFDTPNATPAESYKFIVPFFEVESELHEVLRQYLSFMRAVGIIGPIALGISLHRMGGAILDPQVDQKFHAPQLRRLENEHNSIELPPVIIEESHVFQDRDQMRARIMEPITFLWREAGLTDAPQYEWTPP